jgi:Flp pilus assembly protein CpaB
MALAYLLTLAGSLVALAVMLRRRSAPITPPTAPAPAPALSPTAEAEIRTILVAAAQLAAKFRPAA